MKEILLAGLMSLTIAAPAIARCDDNVSYMINQYGQCIDLTDTTNLGVAELRKEYINREINPFLIKNLILQPSLKERTDLTGRILNHSSKTMLGVDMVLRFERKRDGKTEVIGSLPVSIDGVFPSGKEYGFKASVPNPGLGTSVVVESAEPVYRDE